MQKQATGWARRYMGAISRGDVKMFGGGSRVQLVYQLEILLVLSLLCSQTNARPVVKNLLWLRLRDKFATST